HVPEGLLFEDISAVVLGGQVVPVEKRRSKPDPVDGVEQDAGCESPLDVLFQEAALEVLEDPVPEKSVVGGCKATTRDPGNSAHLVEKPSFASFDGHLAIPQLFE